MFGLDSLYNVKNQWTIEDLYDAHEAIDIKLEMEEYSSRRES